MTAKQKIEQLISSGDTAAALNFWKDQLESGEALLNELLLAQSRLSNLETEQFRGQITPGQARIALNHLNQALLGYLAKWNPGGDTGPLHEAIRQLHPEFSAGHPAGPVLLLNCDRGAPAKRFRRAFAAKTNQSFQFYFICACPDEMPQSLAKRLVYQLIEDKLDQQHNAISYPFREDPDDRLRVDALPVGDDLDASKKRFKAYVQRRFAFADTQSFETFIETGVPKLHFEYVASVFDLSENVWDDDEGEMSAYLDWMIETFRCPHPDVPTFLFFFVVYIKNLHDESRRSLRGSQILAELDALCKRHEATLLTELLPLENEHLHDWLRQFDVRDPNQAGAVVNALVQSLRPAERRFYADQQRIHMKDVEPLQRLVYKAAQQNTKHSP